MHDGDSVNHLKDITSN